MHLRPSSVIHLILVLGVAALGCATEPSEAQPHAGGAAAAEAGQGGGLSSGSGGAAGTGATSGAPSGGSSGGTTTGGRANGGATAGGTTSDGASTGATTGAGAAGMGSAGVAGAGMGGASSGGLAGTAGAPLGGAPSGGVAGAGGAAIGGSGGAPTDGFVHPGVVFNRADLERMKSNLGVEPWKAGHERFRARNTASLSYAMQGPFATVGREPNLNRSQYENDMTAVRDQAIMWYLTGTRAYADKAIQILNAWASTHTTWSGGTPGLLSGDFGYFAATGAEIIRHTGAGWSAADIARVETYFKDVVYRLNISVGRPEDPVGEANQGASHLKSMIAIAVFANDRAKFDYTLNSFRNGVCTAVTRNFLPTGQNAEAGRDQPHPLGGLQNFAQTAETAWKQGVDLYGEANNRLLAGSEYWARYNLGGSVPFSRFGDCHLTHTSISATGRSASIQWAPMEMLYTAYAVRKGLAAPDTLRYRNGLAISENTFFFRQ
ncbi:MAG TPA: alginate lyase family protein [Polyangiaceae bacterium]|nr:alginate lyase family protein [Polyangiaceae bacterium]